MRNFLQFIWNNQFTFLFFLLEFIGFALLTTNNGFHNSKLQSTSAAITGLIASNRDAYAQYIGLKEENERLMNENLRLRKRLDQQLNTTLPSRETFRYQTAHAINNTYSLGNNFVVLDKGSEDGIAPQQGVIGPEGIVGVVDNVSKHYSTVMPLIHSQSMVSCKLSKNNYFGILHWDGHDDRYAILEDIPNHVGVFAGDSVMTRGASGVFPSDLFVGVAVSSIKNESSGFQEIKVELATDFRNIYGVYVLVNDAKPEMDSLVNELVE